MAERAGRQLTLAEAYRHFGTTDAAGTSPLYEAVAVAIADAPDALAVIERAPEAKRHPTLVLAALHDQVLQGNAADLAEAYATGEREATGALAVRTLVERADAVVATVTARQTQTNETGRSAILYPAIAEAARRAAASSVALVDVGCSAGLNLSLDTFAITYSNGVILGDADSPVQLTCELRGGSAVGAAVLPPVVARIGIDLNPVDVHDPADARWLEACLWPDQPERSERLRAAIALSLSQTPTLLAGNALDLLTDAATQTPREALVVVTTTWALAYFDLADRLRFLRRIDEIAEQRPVAWVSAEGVGIAPGVPTMGDSRLSGHSVVGLAVADGRRITIDAIARCHPHGQWMEWLPA